MVYFFLLKCIRLLARLLNETWVVASKVSSNASSFAEISHLTVCVPGKLRVYRWEELLMQAMGITQSLVNVCVTTG